MAPSFTYPFPSFSHQVTPGSGSPECLGCQVLTLDWPQSVARPLPWRCRSHGVRDLEGEDPEGQSLGPSVAENETHGWLNAAWPHLQLCQPPALRPSSRKPQASLLRALGQGHLTLAVPSLCRSEKGGPWGVTETARPWNRANQASGPPSVTDSQ